MKILTNLFLFIFISFSLFSMEESRILDEFNINLDQANKIYFNYIYEASSLSVNIAMLAEHLEKQEDNVLLIACLKTNIATSINEVYKNLKNYDINSFGSYVKITPLIASIITLHNVKLDKNVVLEITNLILKQKNIDINAKDDDGNTALTYLVKTDDNDIFQIFLNRSDIDINIKNDSGQTATMAALNFCQYSKVIRLIEDPRIKYLMQFYKFYISRYKKEYGMKFESEGYNKKHIKKLNNIIKAERNTLVILKKVIEEVKEKLFNSIIQNNFDDFKYNLLKLGSAYVTGNNGNNILHYAVNSQNLFFLKLIISKWPDLLDMKNNIGNMPIQDSLKNNKTYIFNNFIKELNNL